jgi:nicotinate-nucleotide adenylyltransferase
MVENNHRIGIIGGSFNPIHLGHCRIAECFVQETECNSCYFVPAAMSPLKGNVNTVSSEHRLSMVELATQYNPIFRVCTVELRRGGISYTIDTIHWFQEQFPQSSLFLLIGADQAAEFTHWKQWEDILDAVQLCIVRRAGISNESAITSMLTRNGTSPQWIQCSEINISSTEIRERIKNKLSLRELIPSAVEEYIYKHGLYQLDTNNCT